MADKRTRVMLANLLKGGELYAAHQKYRTTAARLLKTPAPSSFGTGKSHASSSGGAAGVLPYDEAAQQAAELLFDGARALLEKGELGGGTDLSLYLLDVWSQRAVRCDDATRSKVQTLVALAGSRGAWRKSIIDHAVSWTAANPDTPAGDAALHAYIGQVLHKDQDYFGAEHHYVAAQTRDSAKALANLLFEWYKTDPSSSSSSSTLGRYAARGVLSYLESYSFLCANVFLETFLSLAISASQTLLFERLPLTTWPEKDASGETPEVLITRLQSINFLQILIKTCQIGLVEQTVKRPGNNTSTTTYPGKQAFQSLIQRYEREVPWLREPEVKECTAFLGEAYFGIKQAGAGGPNILGDLLGSLFGGGGSGGAAPSGSGSGKGSGRGRGRGKAAPAIGPAGLD